MGLLNSIAWRYLRSRKSHSVVNLIAWVGVVSVLAPVAATIFIVSLHGGLVRYVESLYSDFDAPVRVERVDGKAFRDSLRANLQAIEGVKSISAVRDLGVVTEYEGNQYAATLRGVEPHYNEIVGVADHVTHGEFRLATGDLTEVVLGQGIAYQLGFNPILNKGITFYALRPSLPTAGAPFLPQLPVPLYNAQTALPAGIYAMDETTDSRYIFADIALVQKLAGDSLITAYDVALTHGTTPETAASRISKTLGGDSMKALTSAAQRGSLFKIMSIEKWIIYAMLTVITLIAALALVGAIIIMATEKRTQTAALKQMGLTPAQTRGTFLRVGLMIGGAGTVLGLALGVGLAAVQQQFGVLKLAGDTLLMDAYPVEISITEIVTTGAMACAVTYAISWITVKSLSREWK